MSYELLYPATHIADLARFSAETTGCGGDPENPAYLALAESKVPVVIERYAHVREDGAGYNVLFLDGHVTHIAEENLDAELRPYLALR